MVKKGLALIATCVAWLGFAACTIAPAQAQVEWVTSLNVSPTPIPLTQQVVASAADGSIYAMSSALEGDVPRIRLARLSSSGTEQWVRWLNGSINSVNVRLLLHPDSSASISYAGPPNQLLCVENFSSAGASRARTCFEHYYFNEHRVSLANDGDLYVVYGDARTVTKISPLGTVRWTHVETYVSGTLTASGIDVAGNYFEIRAQRLRTWSAATGNKLVDAPLVNYTFSQPSFVGGSIAIGRQNLDITVLRGFSTSANAQVLSIARYTSLGALVWARDVVFPGNAAYDPIVSVFPADADGVYISLSSLAQNESQVAKLTSTGVISWQKHYASAGRVLNAASGLLAIRTDIGTTTNSYIFSISAADGSLGGPTIYSRADAFAPSRWYPVAGGVVATFQESNTSALTPELAASTLFLGAAPTDRWTTVAMGKLSVSVDQSDSLMPRLVRSSPSASWAARTQASPTPAALADWTSFLPSTGAIKARTARSAAGSGAPITADGSQIIIDYGSVRATRVNTAGATTWQVSSSATPATYSYGQPSLETIASNDVATYVVGSLLGRVSATGSILFETETNRANPRYVAVDSTNNAWVVAGLGGSDGYVSKVSPTGALLWSVAVDAPACSDGITSARLTSSDEMLVATQSCSEGRLFKINAGGGVAWQRIVSGTTLRPFVSLAALHTDTAGNIYAGGCAYENAPPNFAKGISLIASWTAAGSERWSAQSDLIGGAQECITSITTDSSSNVYAAVSSSVTTRAPVLWSFTSAGVERWRHSGVLSAPFASATELAYDSTDRLIALGEAPPNSLGPREATVRRINVATLASPFRLKFLQVPSALVGYREQFSARIGLRTAADVAANATAATVVSLGLQNGAGNLDGSLTCTIAIGASECTIADTRYDVVETGVTLTASADGFAAVISAAIGFTQATTTTTLTVQNTAPYNAFSTIRVRATTLGPPPPLGTGAGSLTGPYSSRYDALTNCAALNLPTVLLANECDALVYTAAFPFAASFNPNLGYLNSFASPFAPSVTKVIPTLQVTNDPGNSYIVGDRVRFRVAISVGTLNITSFIAANVITVTGGTCGNNFLTGNLSNQYAGSYWVCDTTATALGTSNIDIGFLGNEDLLPTAPVRKSVVINAGAIVRGTGTNFPSGVTVCSPTPGVTCAFVGTNNSEWQCAGPSGMSAQVFFVPSASSGSFQFPTSPLTFSNVTGVVTNNTYVPWTYASGICNLDADGDGARMFGTDGALILRRMFGLTGAALTTGATHACVPRSAAGITSAVVLSGFDIDGDGFTRPETDGLLLLRAMLGFRGESLIKDAISPTATRKTVLDIHNYFAGSCSFPMN